jgi:hypothetical protein
MHGRIAVPDGPGLGTELDEDMVWRLTAGQGPGVGVSQWLVRVGQVSIPEVPDNLAWSLTGKGAVFDYQYTIDRYVRDASGRRCCLLVPQCRR